MEREQAAAAAAKLLEQEEEARKKEEEESRVVLEEETGAESKPPRLSSSSRSSIPLSSAEKTPSPMITRRTRGRTRKMMSSSPAFDAASTLDMTGIQPGSVSFLPGSSVFVLWKNGLYPAKILSNKGKETNTTGGGGGGGDQQDNNNAYFVHYDSYHDDFDSWVPLSRIYKITKDTQRVFELSNRGSDNEELEIGASGGSKGSNGGRGDRRTSTPSHAMERRNRSRTLDASTRTTNTSTSSTTITTTTIDMGDLDPGVTFLPGSGVYVTWKKGLFHAKMLKRRKVSEETEYLVHYIGYSESYDAWVPLSRIYEISPQTKRIFGRCKDVLLDSMGGDELPLSPSTSEDADDDIELAVVETPSPKPKQTPNNDNSNSNNNGRGNKSLGSDADNVSPGVEFERNKAMYVEWKNVFYLAKMLKKRTKGRGNHQYFVHYDGFRKSSDTWVSTRKVYKINSQTKQLFNAQRK